MIKRISILLLAAATLHSCKEEKPAKTHREVKVEEGFAEDSTCGDYKRYTGTIAGQPVVMHYLEYGTTKRGEYYYENQGKSITLYNYTDSAATGVSFFAENPLTERDEQIAHWEVSFTGDSITGVLVTADQEKTYPIRLKENYDAGVQQFGIVCMDDSGRLKEDRPKPSAYVSCQLLLPVGNDEATAYLRSVIYKSLNCDTTGNRGIKTCLDGLNKTYFDNYRQDNSALDSTMLGESFNNWSLMTNFWISYNSDNMVVLNHHTYEYTGGAHGNYGSNFLCVDTRNKKVLALADIMNVDTARLEKLLELELRNLYHADPKEPLSAYVLSEEMHVPEQFYLTNKGIMFVFGIYEISAYADGEVNLFLPYNRITDMLTPYFKQRMNLTTVAHK